MAEITILTSREYPQVKTIEDGNVISGPKATFFDHSVASINDLNSLAGLLKKMENDEKSLIIRGKRRNGVAEEHIRRRSNGSNATFEKQNCQWLCIDIDDLALPDRFAEFNKHCDDIAKFVAAHLPTEFHEVNFYYQYSASMGFKPGIRIHLWYWLSEPISDEETKLWLSDSQIKIDKSLYQCVHPHYTAPPTFVCQEENPLPTRSGLILFEKQVNEVTVPDNLK